MRENAVRALPSGGLTTVEVHAEGEPGRVVVDAGSLVHGDTMAERLAYCREHLQWLRTLVLHEPRGYPALCAVLILPPVTPGADFGVVVLEQGGFTPMSGSNTMCAVAARADIKDGAVAAVTLANVPAYVVALDTPLDVPEIGTIAVDVVFGGQF